MPRLALLSIAHRFPLSLNLSVLHTCQYNMDLPSNIFQVYELGKSKNDCISFFQRANILHTEKLCPAGHVMVLSVSDRSDRWRCRKAGCRDNNDIPLRSNTWLQSSKLPFDKILLFLYSWSFELTSVKFCERELEINHNTTVDWNNYLREVCASKLLANPKVIGGPGLTVEIDESVFAKRKYNVGRVIPQQWVFGAICRETRDCFLFAVEDRSAATLLPIIIQHIAPGTTIMSDQWAAYNGIRNANQNYQHLTVNHSRNFVDPITQAQTNTVERLWGTAKSSFRRKHGTHSKLLDSYLCEFMWRKSLQRTDNPFQAILRDIAAYWPPQ